MYICTVAAREGFKLISIGYLPKSLNAVPLHVNMNVRIPAKLYVSAVNFQATMKSVTDSRSQDSQSVVHRLLRKLTHEKLEPD